MTQNYAKYSPVKNNITSILYLYEVAAIPREIREEYLLKILKRKNAEFQKNVKLINFIYDRIEKGNLYDWDSAEICRDLKVSYNTYRFHKSNFLDGLRNYYFLPDKSNSNQEKTERNIKDTESEFYDAKLKFSSGMRKEAKLIFLKLAVKIKKEKLNGLNILIASEIYEHLLVYYYNQHDLLRYNRYLSETKRLVNYLGKQKIVLSKQHSALIKARYYTAMGRKFGLNLVNDSSYTNKLNFYKLAYNEAVKAANPEYLTYVIFHLGELNSVLGNSSVALNYYRKGYEIAEKRKLQASKYGFKALMISESNNKKEGSGKLVNNLAECWAQVKRYGYNSYWFQVVSILYSNCLISVDEEKRKEVNKELVNYLFLRSVPGRAIKILYADKTGERNYVKWELLRNEKGEFLSPGEVNYSFVYELENLVKYITSHYHKISFLAGKIKINLDLLFIEFLKGKNINFESALLLINKIKWGLRDKKLLVRFDGFRLLELAFSMLENHGFISRKEFLYKYNRKFEELSDFCLGSKDENPLYIYLIISLTANWIGYSELTDIAEKKYRFIETNFPNHIKAAIDDIKNNCKE